jgi:sugar O-acyltransferase (sialic acid O-acetyltransferase NeuD family)
MVAADIIRLRGDYELVGFIDDVHPGLKGTEFCQAPILGGQEQLDSLRNHGITFLIFGFGNNAARLKLAELVLSKGYKLATAVHPHAVIAAGVEVGAGTVIKPGAAIDPGVTIGENVIIGSCATVGHGCVLSEGVRISGGVGIAGNVTLGRASTIGVGATIKDRVHVGEHSFIGAGATVVRDIPPGVVAYGVPARVKRKITPKDY